MFFAHIRESDNAGQTVYEHSKNTALLTECFLEPVGLCSVGKLVGLLHDAGKLRKKFDDYINGRNNLTRGSIDHSYAGAKYLESLSKDDKITKTAAIGMAHTIVSHHGLHDWIDDNYDDYFLKRIEKTDGYEEILCNLSEILSDIDISSLFAKAVEEWYAAALKIKTENSMREERYFYIGMLERLIQSALIDADRTDTADFMSGRETVLNHGTRALWELIDKNMDEKLAGFSERTDAISKQRRSISDRCASFAEHKVGACRLIVPTGGGKTLSSFRFAVRQCKKFGMERIFYIAPFMSILEQNSDVISDLCGEENFLEHHSNIVAEIDNEKELEDYQLFTESWNKPVIATTMVQFLNTLFSEKTASVRRMHMLSNSVIIIDEVQSIPLRCTNLFSLAVNFLTKVCGSTVVLCSATQPTFDKNERRLLLDDKPDMIEDYEKVFEVFHRTELRPELEKYGYDLDEAADYCENRFEENGDLLLIVNTKKQALEMYRRMKERLGDKAYIIHLSTNMCPAHRKESIARLREHLEGGHPVVCVTTQLIEAGVDISFSCVVRALAGLDNAAQAAGRCNRSGEKGKVCPVYIINFKGENLGNLEEIKNAKRISENIIRNNEGADLLSVKKQSEYFNRLFKACSDKLDYPAGGTTLLELLSCNQQKWEVRKSPYKGILQSFKTAGELFNVIDNNTKNVIVPYNKEAVRIIDKLQSDLQPNEMAVFLRKAQKYTVSVYVGTECALKESGALCVNDSGVYFLDKRYYSSEYGITTEGSEKEVLIF